ncbi:MULTISPECIES: hypothetical protein [unclassified Paraburkholderia]|uniref:hypothetical protein n=1 Tax=unclassified Paraburkholderia TaxID=2615204 RepID=UPI002AAFCA8A|nr:MULTISPECIES: hypothetical protein [unclassified Paraburkholderia]
MTVQQSLRMAVVKWLAPGDGHTVRVLTVQRCTAGRIVSVCVEMEGANGPRALFFFRHADREWRVFSPDRARPAMGIERMST